MRWYQVKEQAAGIKRLMLMYHIYCIAGKKAVKFITFFVTFFAFIFAPQIRYYSKKYLHQVGVKPTLKNQFLHFLSYANILIDNMETFINKFNPANITFADEDTKNNFFNIVREKKGGFLISSHLGNIHVLRSFLSAEYNKYNVHVNIFLSETQCKIFNEFIRRIMLPQNDVTTYPVEQITIGTPIEIKEKIDRGELVFIAGDRTSKNSTNTEQKLFGQKVQFPAGTFRFAKLMECPVYFICALREGDNSKVYLKKFISDAPKSELADVMQKEFVSFLEKLTPLAPFQFFHFYDLFEN